MSGRGDIMLKDSNFSADRDSYHKIWKVVIQPTIQNYQNHYSEVYVSDNAEEAIWQEYIFLISIAREHICWI